MASREAWRLSGTSTPLLRRDLLAERCHRCDMSLPGETKLGDPRAVLYVASLFDPDWHEPHDRVTRVSSDVERN